MLFAFVYGCLRLLMNVADIRLRVHNPEAELLLLRHELRVLRRQVKRPNVSPANRAIMAAFHRLVLRLALGGLVQPETIQGWHRELVRKKWATFSKRRGVGRPRLDIKLRELILRMARENSSWGCIRIRGELIKLGLRVSTTAIRNLLRQQGLGPAPSRSRLSWKTFLQAQASAIVLSDFFSVDTVFLRRLYVLLYIVRPNYARPSIEPATLESAPCVLTATCGASPFASDICFVCAAGPFANRKSGGNGHCSGADSCRSHISSRSDPARITAKRAKPTARAGT